MPREILMKVFGAIFNLVAIALLSGPGVAEAQVTYTVGGIAASSGGVSGLASGKSVTLLNNGVDSLTLTSDGDFTFPVELASGSVYAVTIAIQPSGQLCSVSNGSGTLNSANISNIRVDCVNTYTVGGNITGLAGSGLVLRLNSTNLIVASGATSFKFSTSLINGALYVVSVGIQPAGYTCLVSNGSGNVTNANVTNTAIACAKTYTVGGTITGLNASGLILRLNGGANKIIPGNATAFVFSTALTSGSAYTVSIQNQPTGQTCTVANGGPLNIGSANITNVIITCNGNDPIKAIMIGDSLAANGWASAVVKTDVGNGFVVTGGPANPVATITTTSPNSLMAGNYIQIVNVGDSAYSDPLNGVVVPVLSVISPTRFTVAASYGNQVMTNGDYSAGYNGQSWLVRSMTQQTDFSWLNWLNMYMQGRFSFVASYAIGGTTSSIGKLLTSKISAGPTARYAFIQYCTNDVNQNIPSAAQQCLDNIQAIVTAVKGLGMTPVLCTPPAIGDVGAIPNDPGSGFKTGTLLTIKNGMMLMAANDPSIILFDTFTQTANPHESINRFYPNYAPIDGLHLSSYGASAIARYFNGLLRSRINAVDYLPTSAADDATLNANASNIVQNGMMLGSSGSITSSAINDVRGTAPTGWYIYGTGGTSTAPLIMQVTSDVPYADMYGSALDIHITLAGPGTGFQLGTNGAGGSSFGQRMQAGKWYQCGFQVTPRTSISQLNIYGQIFLNFGNLVTTSVYFMSPTAAQYDNGFLMVAGEPIELISQPFFIPTQPSQGGYLFINGTFKGGIQDQTISIGRAYCNVVPNPYQ